MAQDFYHQWLGLPPNPLPPDHYTLLGLDLFQEDLGLVNKLAGQRFSRIKVYEDHPDRASREGAIELMNRIALAHAVLTDFETKRQYDRQLVAEWSAGAHGHRIAAGLDLVAGHRNVGRHIALKSGRKLTIGKSPTIGLSLPGERMSPLHATLFEDKGYWLLKAHGDSPITVNGRGCMEDALTPGDRIEMGGYRFRFRITVGDRAPVMAAGDKIRLRLLHAARIEEPWIEALPGESVLIGALESALWQLSEGVEDSHCRVDWTGSGWALSDQSTGGSTRLNGAPVSHAPLAFNDRITIGRYTIVVELARP